jgi:hypothetical protein
LHLRLASTFEDLFYIFFPKVLKKGRFGFIYPLLNLRHTVPFGQVINLGHTVEDSDLAVGQEYVSIEDDQVRVKIVRICQRRGYVLWISSDSKSKGLIPKKQFSGRFAEVTNERR